MFLYIGQVLILWYIAQIFKLWLIKTPSHMKSVLYPLFPRKQELGPVCSPLVLISLWGTVWLCRRRMVRSAAASRSSCSQASSRSHAGFSNRNVTCPTSTAGKRKTRLKMETTNHSVFVFELHKVYMYLNDEDVWAWETSQCLRRPVWCVERPKGNGGGALGLGGPQEAPWRAVVDFQSEWLPAGPPRSAPPQPADDKSKLQPTKEKSFHSIVFLYGFISYPLKLLANDSLLFQLGLHHFLLFAC